MPPEALIPTLVSSALDLSTGAGKVIPAVRETSLRLGRRTLALLRRLHPQIFGSLTLSTPHHAVIVGAAGRMLDLPRTDVLLGYGHSLLAGALAAATRCMPISPMQAQELVVELHPALVRAVDDAHARPRSGTFHLHAGARRAVAPAGSPADAAVPVMKCGPGSGFRVPGGSPGSGFRVRGSGSGFRVRGSGFRVRGAGRVT